jgi:hypothetical protein
VPATPDPALPLDETATFEITDDTFSLDAVDFALGDLELTSSDVAQAMFHYGRSGGHVDKHTDIQVEIKRLLQTITAFPPEERSRLEALSDAVGCWCWVFFFLSLPCSASEMLFAVARNWKRLCSCCWTEMIRHQVQDTPSFPRSRASFSCRASVSATIAGIHTT